MGGGITAVPYAMTVAGLYNGILINLVIVGVVMFCSSLYLQAKEAYKLDNISSLCYAAFGRNSVFFINGLIAFVIYGILTLYFILLARICKSLISELGLSLELLQTKSFFILLIAIILLTQFLKRSISEMKF